MSVFRWKKNNNLGWEDQGTLLAVTHLTKTGGQTARQSYTWNTGKKGPSWLPTLDFGHLIAQQVSDSVLWPLANVSGHFQEAMSCHVLAFIFLWFSFASKKIAKGATGSFSLPFLPSFARVGGAAVGGAAVGGASWGESLVLLFYSCPHWVPGAALSHPQQSPLS